ncbi:MAG TPA: hypothetical protein VF151_09760 [Gemmatimonadales bacterium]
MRQPYRGQARNYNPDKAENRMPACDSKVEITPEMIEAGKVALMEELADDLPRHCPALDSVVARVFAAMMESRTAGS